MRPHTLHRHLAKALATCGLSTLTWYQATRHTFASQWVLNGGSIEKLKEIMGHSSVVVTERYAHLKPEVFRAADYELLNVDLNKRRSRWRFSFESPQRTLNPVHVAT